MGILTAIKRFPSAVIAGFSSFGRRAFQAGARKPLQQVNNTTDGGPTIAAPSVQPLTPSAPLIRFSTPSASQSPVERQLEKLRGEEEKRKRAFFDAAPSLSQLVGQRECVERLKRFGELYAANAQTPEHILITGDEGMGKRMLARASAKAFNTAIIEIDARQLQRPADLSNPLNFLKPREALLILNIHELRKLVAELLETALQRFEIDVHIGQGPGARIHPFQLNRFTCLATAPKIAELPQQLTRCFSLSLTVQSYSSQELKDITVRLASQLGLSLAESVVPILVNASERTPHSIDQMLRRFTRFGKTTITEADAAEALAAFGLAPQQQKSVASAKDLDVLSGVEFEKLALNEN
jgi:Holliday junction resolvasome RuvABC ATP-dependent DNA helicase subunit